MKNAIHFAVYEIAVRYLRELNPRLDVLTDQNRVETSGYSAKSNHYQFLSTWVLILYDSHHEEFT